MKKSTWLVGALVMAAALASARAGAATITFYSGDGHDLVNGGNAVVINPHSVWGDVSVPAGLAALTADWIAYANTGLGGIISPDVIDREIGHQTALFSRTFTILDVSNLSLWSLAD